ncbi:hypothetical protein F5Y19DRAFT_461548 [Xylariaceae sp. FL1651]|nr:hypothetical protein F5Y19DRAFT_461548 [Xylariaceae sp. FL1651]
MAILEDVPGIEVTVDCGGRSLHELEDPNAHDDDGAAACPTANKYIECIDDAEFAVIIKVDNGYEWGYRNHVLVATTYVDGQHIRGIVLRSSDTRYESSISRVRGHQVYSSVFNSWSLRRFKFALVKTVDEAQKERVQDDLKTAKNLGTIEVTFTRAIEHGPSSRPYRDNSDAKSGDFELAEKSLKGKAVSHGTSYGSSEAIGCPKFIDARDILEDNGPIAVFKFMYRSREALKREFIIPRSPSRSPTLDDLTPAERDRLARERLNELRAKVKRENENPLIKREFGEVLDLTQDESPPRATKKSRLQGGTDVDVIDLTDD